MTAGGGDGSVPGFGSFLDFCRVFTPCFAVPRAGFWQPVSDKAPPLDDKFRSSDVLVVAVWSFLQVPLSEVHSCWLVQHCLVEALVPNAKALA